MTDTLDLMPIGRFSSMSRISVRMLRHYDAHGVLVPADVDPITGYRRYTPAQLADAAAIRRLRDVGFGVSAIGAMLALRGTPGYDAALAAHRVVLALAADEAIGRLRLLDQLLTEKDTAMDSTTTETVAVETVPARTVASLRGTVADYAAEGTLWERLFPALQEQGIVPGALGGCIEHDDEFREHDVDESVFVDVPAGTTAHAPVRILNLPERRAVVAAVVGPYHEAIPRAHELIGAAVAEQGLTLTRTTGDPATHHFNVYLDDPCAVPPERLRTKVYVPVV
ncbi:Transcriptional regulator, MerR family OS=Tsukamurella paurometabola (strain ATCC 8368 / DSM/ CCUG 35730 / CIP 100753 / JCM 10117 / KCTC 9821 / NBRC 16120/ NCIMB 702349 / NCTC 13040) OX=521096 GN=Tpau_2263 PE=4 SV=1 [Tsukamurella paurometabola]|uniref:Transcriptional regulator, MerR family n=1 Tax=Tsukamurella paurometabola (strain ATCC 8368 / DSM 20162 / CCUG 35730 / CIP 100753 / JCM 10117 / KCTC 9821 / NBRC 16120 / NCIMB 702349 / NCTC 13040) TaxID=521096 RepID=D5UQA2_TSUPD|nr:GyrI-like domain-containing protein [Tsukamurella paurometabola]ADG78872.1 transcriptional regulator, MerR family [Tsukamurella paurometabola DSM 20162]SUP33383.1 Copper export regulator [Tsukamurella paurometabola]